jgi:hypothetical protein
MRVTQYAWAITTDDNETTWGQRHSNGNKWTAIVIYVIYGSVTARRTDE